MTRRYVALVVSIDEIVEEEVVLLIENVEVKCFLNYCPSKIEVGKQYEIELEMVLVLLPTRPPRHPARTHRLQRRNRLVGAIQRLRQSQPTDSWRRRATGTTAALPRPVLRRGKRPALQPASVLPPGHRALSDAGSAEAGGWFEFVSVHAEPDGVGGSVGVGMPLSWRCRCRWTVQRNCSRRRFGGT